MDITLFEEVNLERLHEVISCDNIPFKDADDDKREAFKRTLKSYARKKHTKKGFEVKYTRPSNYGRYMAKGGLQGFQKEVRKYLCGEYVRDFDFENCHPVLLEQLFKKNDIYAGEFLEEYNKNRSSVIEKHKLKDKQTVISVMNNENKPSLKVLQEFHSKIYDNLFPKLQKQDFIRAHQKRT